MHDDVYNPDNVPPECREIFEQIKREFPPPYEVWRRTTGLGQGLYAAVLDKTSNVAVVVPVLTEKVKRSVQPLSREDLERIRAHFVSGASEDLTL
jgi:hypothetical protein